MFYSFIHSEATLTIERIQYWKRQQRQPTTQAFEGYLLLVFSLALSLVNQDFIPFVMSFAVFDSWQKTGFVELYITIYNILIQPLVKWGRNAGNAVPYSPLLFAWQKTYDTTYSLPLADLIEHSPAKSRSGSDFVSVSAEKFRRWQFHFNQHPRPAPPSRRYLLRFIITMYASSIILRSIVIFITVFVIIAMFIIVIFSSLSSCLLSSSR